MADRRYHKTRMSARQDLEDSRERSSRARREHGDAINENMEKPDKYLASPGCSLRAPDEAPALQTDHSERQIAHILHQNNPYFTLSPWSGVNPNKLLALNQNSQGGVVLACSLQCLASIPQTDPSPRHRLSLKRHKQPSPRSATSHPCDATSHPQIATSHP